MNIKLGLSILALTGWLVSANQSAETADKPVQSDVIKTDAGDLILSQELVVEAPVADVWAAYTTADGWMAWAAPLVEVDLRTGGTIMSNYADGASIGDPGTNTINIVNYVPERVLTLRADVAPRWPEVMKEGPEHLMNVILFESLGEKQTRISSYGVGYNESKASDDLMKFFIPANEGLLKKLKDYLEK